MRLDPEKVARYFGIADEDQFAAFDPKKHDLGTGPSGKAVSRIYFQL